MKTFMMTPPIRMFPVSNEVLKEAQERLNNSGCYRIAFMKDWTIATFSNYNEAFDYMTVDMYIVLDTFNNKLVVQEVANVI